MKTIFVTYNQNGVPKKGKINEDRYTQLNQDPSISQLVVYPTELLMENNYRALTSNNGSKGSRNIILG